MKKSTKIILAVVVAIIALTAAICCGLIFFGYTAVDDAMDPEFTREIAEFSKNADEYACEKEALVRAEKCSPIAFGCKIQASVFNGVCLNNAKPSEGFCDRIDVDPNAGFMEQSFQMGLWSGEVCKESSDPQTCQNVMQETGKHCLKLSGK